MRRLVDCMSVLIYSVSICRGEMCTGRGYCVLGGGGKGSMRHAPESTPTPLGCFANVSCHSKLLFFALGGGGFYGGTSQEATHHI